MTFPIDRVRAQFPSLALKDNGQNRIYLDNPAGTQVPQRVINAVSDCFLHSNANQGGYFRTSRASDTIVDDAHAAMADFLGTDDAGEIIIGANTTSLTFHMSRSICRDFEPGDEIVLTRMDHEGNVSPWLEIAADMGLVIRWVEFDTGSWRIEPEALRAILTSRTRLVAINYASNLTGAINDVKALVAEAKAVGALSYIDAVQLAPHSLVDVVDLGCDFLVCSPYKFFGPHLGVFWGRRDLLQDMRAYKCRCVPDQLSTKFETGSPAIELLAGLTAVVEYFIWLGDAVSSKTGRDATRRAKLAAAFAASELYEADLSQRLITGLQGISGLHIIGPDAQNQMTMRVPTISFRHEHIAPDLFAKKLSDDNIFVWSGHNYAIGIVEQLGIPENEGVVRVGPAHYNTVEEVDLAVAAIGRTASGG